MERKKIAINYLLLAFIAVCVIAQVFILNKHSTMGDQLTSLDKKITDIEEENNRIHEKIASLSAMATIAEKAKEYGLVASSSVLSVGTSLPIAANLKLSL